MARASQLAEAASTALGRSKEMLKKVESAPDRLQRDIFLDE
ncbi:MAG: hypothetical protein QNL12_10520 [Acidimicrobiia bacterium]|nr:hypothetical protein [Acidimicrobiia bacterium]MDX2467739.1 hypothetical protein [Acidimicrobiia bacterium]